MNRHTAEEYSQPRVQPLPTEGIIIDEADRLLNRDECERIIHRIKKIEGNANTTVIINAWWQGELRWGRNRISLASDRRDIQIIVVRDVNGAIGVGMTNQVDDVSLEGVTAMAERSAQTGNRRDFASYSVTPPDLITPKTTIWSESSYNLKTAASAAVSRSLSEAAEHQSLSAAGYVEFRAAEQASITPIFGKPDTIDYRRFTQSQCSMTVRSPRGAGSGWAGLSSFDWAAINPEGLSKRVLDKCLMSLNPVAIEPGRYTTILEPQAAFTFVQALHGRMQDRAGTENGYGAFALEFDLSINMWRTKLGLQIIDERLTIDHDPTDPLLGIAASPGLMPVTWVERGVLTSLSYRRDDYSLPSLNENLPTLGRQALRVSGGDVTREEMIATTKRGLLVTRFSNVSVADEDSILLTGFTRDGLWLIENGKISKPVKNFRFLESPLFAFNQLDQLGLAEPVFYPNEDPYEFVLHPAVVPTMKVKDFSFTHLVDAV